MKLIYTWHTLYDCAACLYLLLCSGIHIHEEYVYKSVLVIFSVLLICWMFCGAVQIFTEDMEEVKSLPRENVLNFIEKADETLVVPYLVSCLQVIFWYLKWLSQYFGHLVKANNMCISILHGHIACKTRTQGRPRRRWSELSKTQQHCR